mgnify:CR=1 FL=1
MSKKYKNVNGVRTELTTEELNQYATDNTVQDKYKLMAIRNTREPLLREADHSIFILEDAGSNASAWRTYRQRLRDITKGNLDNPSWPNKPS